MVKVIAVVPLKENSQRLPNKNMTPLNGKPLFHYILETLAKVKKIDEIYIFSSSDKFDEIPSNCNEKIKFKRRNPELDSDETQINDVIRAFVKEVEADLIILAHATSPFISVNTLNTCLEKILNNNFDSAFAASELRKFCLYQGIPINFKREEDLPQLQKITPIVVEQGGLYVFGRNHFLTENSRVGQNPYIHIVNEIEKVDIDYPDDLVIAESFLKKYLEQESK